MIIMKKVFSIIGICFGIMIMIFGLLSLGGQLLKWYCK